MTKKKEGSIIHQELVPEWLCGTWNRDYIKRRVVTKNNKKDDTDNNDNDDAAASDDVVVMGPPNSSVHVRYIQTPWAFVDVRRALGTSEGSMGFAGVTSVVVSSTSPSSSLSSSSSSSIPTTTPLVRWHACLDMDYYDDLINKEKTNGNSNNIMKDIFQRWSEADNGKPRKTPDEGYFEKLPNNMNNHPTYKETDPDQTLEEQWVRIDNGCNKFLAVRYNNCSSSSSSSCSSALLVVAGNNFGYASLQQKEQQQEESSDEKQQSSSSSSSMMFVAGRRHCQQSEEKQEKKKNTSWIIEVSPSNQELEGKSFVNYLPGQLNDWIVLPGSTLDLDYIKDLFLSQ